MKNIRIFPALFLLLSLQVSVFAGGERETSAEDSRVKVFVSVLPQKYFVERIGGDRVSVEVLVEPGRDPHVYDPTPRQVARIAEGDIFFTIGMPFEETLLPKVRQINRQMVIADTLEGIDLLYGVPHYHYDEDGKPYLHSADEPDPHIWLGPREVRRQIKTIKDSLVKLNPDGAERYTASYKAFDREIAEMDARFEEMLKPLKGKSILAFHPAFAYFTNTYGITQKAIELDGKEPSPRHLERMIDEALREGTRVIFTQPEFPQRSARIIANAIGGKVVSLNPLEPDWLSAMEKIALSIASGVY